MFHLFFVAGSVTVGVCFVYNNVNSINNWFRDIFFVSDNSIDNYNRSYIFVILIVKKIRTEYRINMSTCQNKHHKINNITTQTQIVPNLELLYLKN